MDRLLVRCNFKHCQNFLKASKVIFVNTSLFKQWSFLEEELEKFQKIVADLESIGRIPKLHQ